MSKKIIFLLSVAVAVMLTGCGEKQMAPDDVETKEEVIVRGDSNE